jgi:hypothetical protein
LFSEFLPSDRRESYTSSSFGAFATSYLRLQPLHFETAATVVDVFDRYYIETSIKSVRHRVYQVNEGSAIPDWRQFLANTKK